ncbi:MAG: hypothetical protein H6R26_2069 [Proteobacteria bacterium]|nr:hypothetical protein [Pseudomonadota bacterium]
MDNKRERRNYYRILHVQPEAPHEVIVASYRSLMSKLRHHPDLGGDHESAAKINEAYAVLSDPEKRRAYDRARQGKQRSHSARSTTPSAAASSRASKAYDATTPTAACPFCAAIVPGVIEVDSRCAHCDSPLVPIANRLSSRNELLGRRTGTRVGKVDAAIIHLNPGKPASAARLRDLSATGISVFTAAPVNAGRVVRIVTNEIDVVASVVKVRTKDRIHIVHARLLTACFLNQAGVFVSMTV